MSEESIESRDGVEAAVEDAETEQAPVDAEATGHAEVDAVIASLDGVEELPVADQVRVFEAAHESLRAALADAGNESNA